ncbi:hypothetical protein [Lacticaseibacillus manihotivorans]|uniref:hypothetical protein n=1 Tax=Lacticaseibacillus manihotivorans TaxID=88233 RepID=UPI000B06DFF1|nr:hypothetical protein [Lacticaseibacillus manihotivorans]
MRTRERRLAHVVSSARKQLIVVLVLLAGVLVYDRVLPHFGIGLKPLKLPPLAQRLAPRSRRKQNVLRV